MRKIQKCPSSPISYTTDFQEVIVIFQVFLASYEAFSIIYAAVCYVTRVAGVSKKAREGNETANECEK